MEELKDIKLDLLFRIDFFALTNFGKNGNLDDEKFEKEKESLKKAMSLVITFKENFKDTNIFDFPI